MPTTSRSGDCLSRRSSSVRDMGPAADVIDDDPLAEELRLVWLASRADTIYAGANEIQLNLIAERALGMPR